MENNDAPLTDEDRADDCLGAVIGWHIASWVCAWAAFAIAHFALNGRWWAFFILLCAYLAGLTGDMHGRVCERAIAARKARQ